MAGVGTKPHSELAGIHMGTHAGSQLTLDHWDSSTSQGLKALLSTLAILGEGVCMDGTDMAQA